MMSRTRIHSLPDDILVRILWHSKHPTRWESDPRNIKYTVWPWLNEYCGIHAVEYDVFFQDCDPILMPSPSSNAAWNLLISAVCRRWRGLARRYVSTILVKPGRVVSRQDLANAVSCFPSLTHLHLCQGSVETLDDAFLSHLATSCPKLTAFHVGERITPDHYDPRKDLHPVTETGLNRFFSQCTKLEQLSLFCLHKDVKLPHSFFQLTRLRSLVLPDASALDVPEFANLSSLTTLRITSQELEYQQLSALLRISSLTSLSLPRQIRISPTDQPSAAFAISQLHRLKSLSYPCPQFDLTFPSGSPCTSIEHLRMSSSDTIESLPDDIGDLLPSLRELEISYCRKLIQLPEGFSSLSRLESLKISQPGSDFSLPDDFGFPPTLKTLVLVSLPVSLLPDSFCELTSLETLVLDDCKQLRQLPAGFCSLTALKTLCLLGLTDFVLPDDIGMLTSLEIFRMNQNFKQRQLPSSFTQLTSLTGIDFDTCFYISELPEGLENLVSLQQLHIRSCPIVELPESITRLTKLEVLTIHCCDKLSTVPARMDSLTRLTALQIDNYKSLKMYPKSLPPSLEILSWGNSERAIPMPDFSRLPNLTALSLRMVATKRGLAVSRSLSRLQHLELILGKKAKNLPFVFRSLSHLRSLAIYSAGKIQQLPEDIGSSLPALRHLRLQDLTELTQLPGSIVELKHLTSLEIIEAAKLTNLPAAIGSLSKLKSLDLAICPALEYLPASLTQLPYLNQLGVASSGLLSLPPGLANLTRLRCLDLGGCKWLQTRAEDFSEVEMLRHLDVCFCDQVDGAQFAEPCITRMYGLSIFKMGVGKSLA